MGFFVQSFVKVNFKFISHSYFKLDILYAVKNYYIMLSKVQKRPNPNPSPAKQKHKTLLMISIKTYRKKNLKGNNFIIKMIDFVNYSATKIVDNLYLDVFRQK